MTKLTPGRVHQFNSPVWPTSSWVTTVTVNGDRATTNRNLSSDIGPGRPCEVVSLEDIEDLKCIKYNKYNRMCRLHVSIVTYAINPAFELIDCLVCVILECKKPEPREIDCLQFDLRKLRFLNTAELYYDQ